LTPRTVALQWHTPGSQRAPAPTHSCQGLAGQVPALCLPFPHTPSWEATGPQPTCTCEIVVLEGGHVLRRRINRATRVRDLGRIVGSSLRRDRRGSGGGISHTYEVRSLLPPVSAASLALRAALRSANEGLLFLALGWGLPNPRWPRSARRRACVLVSRR
jgi:hypothetical protein